MLCRNFAFKTSALLSLAILPVLAMAEQLQQPDSETTILAGSTGSSTGLQQAVSVSPATGWNPFVLIVTGSPSVGIGGAVSLLVTVAPQAGTIEPVKLSCAGLPEESTCTFGTETLPVNGGTTSLQIGTMAPHSCESGLPSEQSSGLPFTGPALAGLVLLFLPIRRRRPLNGLLLVIAACGMVVMTGCGSCTDLGTRPGDYAVRVIGTSAGTGGATVITQIMLHVTVP